MATLDVNELNITKKQLHVPSLDEVKEVLKEGLLTNFAEFQVEVVDCPNLMQEPFTLAAPGLGGNPTLLEIGGPPFLLPMVQRNKVYDIRQLLNHLQYNKDSFVVGAGAGPWPYANTNCELMMNVAISSSNVTNGTRISSVDKTNGNCVLQTLPNEETRCALLANLFVSEGKPGKVLQVRAKKRTGNDDFIACMQKAIAQHYQNDLVGLGGTFLMKDGKIKQHIMPDFSATPLNTEAQLNNWLNFFNMSTPLIAVGTFVSSESDVDLRVQHFHSFSHHGEGGHYHIDTTPETIEYLGYFNLGTTLYRIDQPTTKVQFGKD
ncbi:ester hydrolase C11orf54 homolog [Megachile rotundata]|uniref:ester hydrolase C11orf54 homolog n=1 Tax=Megachile rotundata TaxID=143995 RepID=UPI000258E3D2|nr:PREDICTED: ester hydrolase C11orf54 homolog [Megachile rotundata]XP_012139089.1 PREDICTED: ester hydrolase C11orf54 homolog [Megachile rotundata]XP_012139091.1 PREDICTED: ester hydrolase C11orf54 homolog [Megachile rotundata]XP_012139092.1 PREDICTED: ester hydrolase C11orf54 homolog [Megachile rotundata]